MWEYMARRARQSGKYILETGATVRACAEHFGISKSTVHDAELCEKVRKVLERNLSERHIRGGNATKRKYASR